MSTSPGDLTARPKLSRMLWRAVRLRCPWCASRRNFIRRWWGKFSRCRACGLQWRREDGFELGPMTLNIIFTFIVLVVSMTTLLILTSPDIPVGPLAFGLAAVALVVPVVLYPFTFLLWFAADLAARPPDAGELADAHVALVASAGDGPPSAGT